MTIRFIATLIACSMTVAVPVFADASVTVRVPPGLTSSGTTADAATEGSVYVVVENVRIKNPSNVRPQSYRVSDFQLVIGEKRYTPTPRPHLGAIDLSQDGILSPNDVMTTNLAFLVPIASVHAVLEFLPADWVDSYGTRIAYCCI